MKDKWYDTQISVTRQSLSLLIGREIPLDEWMLISSLGDTSSLGVEPGTKHFWNSVDKVHGVSLVCTISPSDLQAYMVASKKYLSKALWKKLVDSQENEDNNEDTDLADTMTQLLKEIDVPSHCSSSHVAYWMSDADEERLNKSRTP